MELNPFSHEFHEDPYPTYRWLRDNAPVYRHPDGWYALSRYEDVIDTSQQPLLYSSAEGTTLEKIDTAATLPMMIFMDPPPHDINRKLVSRVFTPRAVGELEGFVRRTASEFLDALGEKGGGDFVEEFSALLPMNVIMELIGVPSEDRNQVREWLDIGLTRIEEPPFIPDRAIEAIINNAQYYFDLVAEKRKRPDDGLASRLCEVETTDEEGNPTRLTDAEVVGFCSLIGGAGTETVQKLLANAMVLFQRNPDSWATVLEHPDRFPDAVEEILRIRPPSQYQGRVLTGDDTRHGVTIPEGSRVLLLTGSANHDEREYPDPERFDLDRPAHISTGFGHGIHFCLGASLARMEGRIGLEEIAKRFPDYEVDEANARRVHMGNVHGYASLPFLTRRRTSSIR